MNSKFAIIVASGTGSRMGSDIPKQFLKLGNKPILVHTIEKFLDIHDCQIILALSEDGFIYWNEIKNELGLNLSRIQSVLGGETRYHSVQNALALIPNYDNSLVAVHDGVRPFVSLKTILNSFVAADVFGSAVTYVDSKDSVRILDSDGNKSIDRSSVKLIQTPQTFKSHVLKEAYESAYTNLFTDDASVVEKAGYSIHLIEGDYHNIKITTPEDLLVGEIILNKLEQKH